MLLHGQNVIGSKRSAAGSHSFYGFDPRAGQRLPTAFYPATPEEIDTALSLAIAAQEDLAARPFEDIATLLDTIAGEIELLGDTLLHQAAAESGLPLDRLTGERARTVNQLRLFAQLVRDGVHLDVRIDRALPDRKPLPRPDLRRMLRPIGPVVVFGASNFPLAFSVAGGDTAAALAARNPVVVKGHPAHPGTSELVAEAIARAVGRLAFPEGTFSLLHATDPTVSIALVQHPAAKAVAFTGSERAGRAIFDAAAQRPQPIPAYVEMGSINPVFVLPGALRDPDALARQLFQSINLGVGQFCTSPGVVAGHGDDFSALTARLATLFEAGAPGTMLHPGILAAYQKAVAARAQVPGVHQVGSKASADPQQTQALPVFFETDGRQWLANESLGTEIFGPSSVAVHSASRDELLRVSESLDGTLTASIFGTEADLRDYRDLVAVLETKAGRLLFNSLPTGVEVTHAMHHGGPYPATADPKFTSVGTASIARFLRPVCFQNFPQALLPVELQDANPRGMWRLIDGTLTKDPL